MIQKFLNMNKVYKKDKIKFGVNRKIQSYFFTTMNSKEKNRNGVMKMCSIILKKIRFS